ncbi:GNAT family N-acetyltransferase [Dyella soli]|uniref:GNAT family N-acetyltransferase n=1 Tax=Dyella soli TaxID=522319 RepID=A0A4R0YSU9_9GAMM|nr:GNAT family N-acetyltransferase [Dyella soli]TCI09913.1 GNAT family N-acetyltransferase [Dyella soli]
MNIHDFHVEHADWARDSEREALRGIRMEVFMQEQGVPASLEWDELDSGSLHQLARDGTGEPIGCARLTPHGKIGRVAVRQPWRQRGVGAAMLRALIARARALGRREIMLDAQLSAVAFYQREGFEALGDVFEDAGIRHQAMRLLLGDPTPGETAPAAHREELLPCGSRSELAASRLQLLTEAAQRLSIYQPLLTDDAYASPSELAELRRIATSGRGAQIRLLLHDPAAALRNSHRLIALAQRLPSLVLVRTPIEELDLAYGSSYLLTDRGGHLFQPDATRASGRAARTDRAAQAPLMQHFNEVWERSLRASALQPLDL